MAPICADPRQFVITFPPPQRQTLLKLVQDVTNHMLAQLENPGELGPVEVEQPSSSQQEQGGEEEEGEDGKAKEGKSGSGPSFIKTIMEPSKKAERIQQAAVKHMKAWRKEFMSKFEEMALVDDDDKILNERQKRLDALKKSSATSDDDEEDLIDLGGGTIDKSEDFFSLQLLYEPIPTRLTTAPKRDRKEALGCILLLLLSTGKYSAHSRTLTLYLAASLQLSQSFVIKEETEIAKQLIEASTADDAQKDDMNAEAEAAKRQKENKFARYWKVGLASVAGATIIGVTGGLAAPLVAGALGGVLGGIGLGGVASFLGIFWMNGALVGALFGAFGAKMTVGSDPPPRIPGLPY